MKIKETIRNIMFITVMCLSLTAAKGVSASADEQSEDPKPKLLEQVTLGYGGVSSWIAYTYVEKHDSYKGTQTEYSYSEAEKPSLPKTAPEQ